jgi:hypothetical protein
MGACGFVEAIDGVNILEQKHAFCRDLTFTARRDIVNDAMRQIIPTQEV